MGNPTLNYRNERERGYLLERKKWRHQVIFLVPFWQGGNPVAFPLRFRYAAANSTWCELPSTRSCQRQVDEMQPHTVKYFTCGALL